MQKFLAVAVLGVVLHVAVGCRTTIQNHRVTKADFPTASRGIPWVEPRQYDVYVYQGNGANVAPATDGIQLYYGRHYLLDEVSGRPIDDDRPRWQTNYDAGLFADGTILLSFDEYGALKKAEVSSSTGLPGATKAAAAAAEIPATLESKELQNLERELKLLETRKKINEARTAP